MTIDITTATRDELAAEVLRLRADIALQSDALLRWREMTGCDTPHTAMEAVRAAPLWEALASARGTYLARCTFREAHLLGLSEDIERAKRALMAAGIDPCRQRS